LNAFGLVRRYRPLETEKLAAAMIGAVKSNLTGIHIIASTEIQQFAGG
jgi:hypothetical protein